MIHIKRSFIILLFLFMSACSIFEKNKIDLSLRANKNINTNIYNKSSPVAIMVYQLKSTKRFKKETLDNLTNPNFNCDEIISQNEIELRPNQSIKSQIKLSKLTKYIGLVAEFRHPDAKYWKEIIDLNIEIPNEIEIIIKNNKMLINH